MSDGANMHIRWNPLPELPEHPCETAHINYDGERLAVTAIYAMSPPARAILIDFGRVEAFKAYEEMSDPWMDKKPSQPFIENAALNPWVWPLQQVVHSNWIERVLRRNGGIDDYDWRHYVIVTTDITLHVMTAGEPDEVALLP
ncbi:hypothetical protein NS355_02280 [Sphingomonas yabuuchiae]|uniref:Uncharacterized protein n=1 Tax=Sphingomonas yabuuchiae TaxID=172044 RepID=A0A147IZK5_9SPHN|nr:hypothetical protein [Sphingomonas yabuuchiae]KTW01035.1 hypothetical protein NS355_02280 [Sphingomonas yabuuchiae]